MAFTSQDWNQVTARWVGKTPGYTPVDWDAVTAQWAFRPDSPSVSASGVLSSEAGTSMRARIADQVLSGSWGLYGFSEAEALIPGTAWPGYQFDGTSITIPLAALPDLTATEAATDWREVLQAFLVSANRYLEPTLIVERPRMFQVRLLDDWNYPHPTLGQVLRREVWFRLHVDIITRRVADEP